MAVKATGRLLIRADGGAGIGLGHLTRTLALSQAWVARGGQVALLSSSSLPQPLARVFANLGEVHLLEVASGTDADATATLSWCERLDARYVVVDGYTLGAVARAIPVSKRVLFDDEGTPPGDAHTFINQNLHGTAVDYRAWSGRICAGLRYACLRQPFWPSQRRQQPQARDANHVVVSLGGADALALTVPVVQSLVAAGYRVTALIGSSVKDATDVKHRVLYLGAHAEIDASDTAQHFASAAFAVIGAGVSTWEALAMGAVPVLISTAPNQAQVAVAVERAGLGVVAVDTRELHGPRDLPAQLTGALQRVAQWPQQHVVDGNGAHRVALALAEPRLALRPLVEADTDLLLEWTNEAAVRAQSFQTEPVARDAHVAWVKRRLTDHATAFYLGEDRNGRPVGPVRFLVEGDSAVISVSVGSEHRGQGLAAVLIDQGCEMLFLERGDVQRVFAEIKTSNVASIRSFERAGFRLHQSLDIAGSAAIRMVRPR